jgi:hypothetical protein
MTEWRMEGHGGRRVYSMQFEHTAVLDLGNAVEADLSLVGVDMRYNAIGWFFIDLGSWCVSAYDK